MTLNTAVANDLRRRHSRARETSRHWCARAVTGPSVIRVFAKGTKEDLLVALPRVRIDQISELDDRAAFEQWFERQLAMVAKVIARRNSRRASVNPGLKWGHAAKVLALYVRDVVLHTRYFTDEQVARITPWLFVPVDSMVMMRLRELGVRLPFRQIKAIATRKDFYVVQDFLLDSCSSDMARVIFDDLWADRGPVA